MKFLDYTKSLYGRRMLFSWVCAPLMDTLKIQSRQTSIADLIMYPEAISSFWGHLEKVPDLERLSSAAFCEVSMSNVPIQRLKDFY